MLFKSLKTTSLTRLGQTAALLAVFLPALSQGATEYAPIMPKAVSSVMIDLAKAGSRIVAVGERGHVLFSDDQGDNWTQGKMPFLRMLTGVHFVDNQLGWAVGHQSMIFHTTDGGETWTRQLEGFDFQRQVNTDNLARSEQAYKKLSAELNENPSEGRELELEDALFAWEDAQFYAEEAPVPTNLHDVLFLDRNRGWAVGAYGRMVQTVDGGNTWIDASHRVATEEGFHFNAITATGTGELIIAGEGGILFRSMDAGDILEQLDSGNYGSFFGIVHDATNGLTTAFGLGGTIFQSSDFGSSWAQRNSHVTSALAGGAVTSEGKLLLVGAGGLLLTMEATDASPRPFPQSDRKSLSAILPLDPDNYILAGAGGVKRAQLK